MDTEHEAIQVEPLPFETHQYIFEFRAVKIEDQFPFGEFMKKVYNWCLEIYGLHGYSWYVYGNKVFFDNDEQAMSFKLRWS